MKKSITLFIIVAILIVSASFAFTSCDSSSNGINPNDSSNTSLPDPTAKPDGTTQNDQNGTVDDSGNNENNNSHTHSFGEWSVVQAATCTQNGVEEAICSCGEKITKTLASLGHIFESNVCTACGVNASQGFDYKTNSDGTTCRITGMGSCTDMVVIIPSEIDGYTVTSINGGVFKLSEITEVVIPNTVTSIGSGAFEECSKLSNVVLGNNVTTIGDYAFYGCSSLTTFIIPDSVTVIEPHAFQGCMSLTEVVIGNGVTSIGECAFYACQNLTTATIGIGLKTVDEFAFYYANLQTVNYVGDEASWNAISKIGNPELQKATVNYNYNP